MQCVHLHRGSTKREAIALSAILIFPGRDSMGAMKASISVCCQGYASPSSIIATQRQTYAINCPVRNCANLNSAKKNDLP